MSALRHTRGLLVGLSLAPTVGCATQAPDEVAAAEPSTQLVAFVSVERLEAAGATHTSVSAKFLRVGEADVDAVDRAVGGRPELPRDGECVPLRELEWSTRPSQLQRLATEGDTPNLAELVRALEGTRGLELLDVGDVILRVRGEVEPKELWLAPRAFPEVADRVSGVFYTSPDASEPLPLPATYDVSGSGSSSAEPFALELVAPAAIELLGVDDAPIPADLALDAAVASIRVGHDLSLSWAPGRSDDRVFVDVGGAEPHRCSFVDDGHAIVPGALIGGVELDDGRAELALSIHRLRELREDHAPERASSEEASTTLVRFDVARAVRLELSRELAEPPRAEP